MDTLLELNKKKIEIQKEHLKKQKEYDAHCTEYSKQSKAIEDKIYLLNNNLDIEKIQHGAELIRLQFPYISYKETFSMIYNDIVEDAKRDIAEDCKKLRTEYFGQKKYGGFDQREDHKYGYGPKHGSTYQSIGLKNPNIELSDYDKECCLYLLGNLKYILENKNT